MIASGSDNWICSVSELARAVGGQLLSGSSASFCRVGTDTRVDMRGKLFVPLKGENFDAHNFVAKAVEMGASAVLVNEWRAEWDALKSRASFVRVADTLRAFQDFAHFWRLKHKFKVIGITGSNGKTSTKEFTYALVKDHLRVHASKGSFNNHWGVPMSILSAGPEHTHLILEMGMNHLGEITRLCQIARPDIVAVTTVGRAHMGELGGQEQVARAKEEIYEASPTALHVFNMDNEWTMRMQPASRSKQIKFSSFASSADVCLRAQRMNWDGLDLVGKIVGVEGQATVGIFGRHNVVNLMCAASLALACGLEPRQIWSGLAQIRDVSWGRNQIVPLSNGARVLFDAYNANPDSVQALFKNLYEMDVPGRKFLILGEMRELGAFSEQAHFDVGESAGGIPMASVWFVGKYGDSFRKGFQKSQPGTKMFFSEKVDPSIAGEMLRSLADGDIIAIKGSRGIELEHVLDGWPLSTPLGKKPS